MENLLKEIIRYATLAPSGHNTQPWKFSINDNSICIYPDYSRRLPIVDPDDHALFISLGCALENLLIAAHYQGFETEVDYFPDNEKEECIRVRLTKGRPGADAALYHAIPQRQSTRRKYNGQKISMDDLQKLERASRQDRVSVMVFTGGKEIQPLIELVKEGNRLQFSNKDFIAELIPWIRFSKTDARKYSDGLRPAVLGFPAVPRWLGRFIMRVLITPGGEARKCEKMIRSSSALILFIAQSNDKMSWINVGRSFERVSLTAASLDIKHAHLNMPCEEIMVRQKLQKHLGLTNQHPLLLLRIGYAKPMPSSFRRPVQQVLTENINLRGGIYD